VLLLSAWEDGVTHHGVYQTGRFDGERFHLAQKHHLDYGLNYFYAAQSFPDEHGRRILFGWIQEGRPIPDQMAAGWSGVMSLPRHATLNADGQLHQEPVDEIKQLRSDHHQLHQTTLQTGRTQWLPDLAGDQLDIELIVNLPPGAALDLGILATPDRTEETVINLHSDENGAVSLALDRTSSSLNNTLDSRTLSGTIKLNHEGTVALRIIIDHSVIEIFANGRPLTARVYPTRTDARNIHLTAHNHAVNLESINAWKMNGIWSPSGRRP
jgi:beta-fructofuranosidase